jgi:hypothetical protein
MRRTVRLLTPHDELTGPKVAEALDLGDGRCVLTEILGLDVLMPGDMVTINSTGVVTGIADPADVYAWEVAFPFAWVNSPSNLAEFAKASTARIEAKAQEYRKAGAYVDVGTGISLTLVSSDERWSERLAADPDVESIELVRQPGQVDLDAMVNERYPS